MKRILFTLILIIGLFSITNTKSYAQSYSSGSYYNNQSYIQDICNGCYCQHAEWHSRYGTTWVYVWNGYQWAYQQRSGYYYWYSWVNYNGCYY